jgi:AraC-like DNA-binding protein
MPGLLPAVQLNEIASLENILVFDLCDPTIIRNPKGVAKPRHPIAFVGPRRRFGGTAYLSGQILSFGIFFRPFAPWQLFGIPTSQLIDLECDGTAVLGSWVTDLWHKLGCSRSFNERVVIATETLLNFTKTARKLTSIMRTVNLLRPSEEGARITRVARDSAMSIRNYERHFVGEVGISPKDFACVSRFARAIDLKRMNKDTWLNISHDLGYFDQTHMIRDFHIFAGEAPGRLVRADSDFQPWSIGTAVISKGDRKRTGEPDPDAGML